LFFIQSIDLFDDIKVIIDNEEDDLIFNVKSFF